MSMSEHCLIADDFFTREQWNGPLPWSVDRLVATIPGRRVVEGGPRQASLGIKWLRCLGF
jgi:hypothetical protein